VAVLAALTAAFGSWSVASAPYVPLTKLQEAAVKLASASNCGVTLQVSGRGPNADSGYSSLVAEHWSGLIGGPFASQLLSLENAANATDEAGTFVLSPQDSLSVIRSAQFWLPWPGQHATPSSAVVRVRIKGDFVSWVRETFEATIDERSVPFDVVTNFIKVNHGFQSAQNGF
jgi:hypothetical protein